VQQSLLSKVWMGRVVNGRRSFAVWLIAGASTVWRGGVTSWQWKTHMNLHAGALPARGKLKITNNS